MYKCLCEHIFSVLLGMYLGVVFLGHMVTLCLTFGGTLDCFPSTKVHPYLCQGPLSHSACHVAVGCVS